MKEKERERLLREKEIIGIMERLLRERERFVGYLNWLFVEVEWWIGGCCFVGVCLVFCWWFGDVLREIEG